MNEVVPRRTTWAALGEILAGLFIAIGVTAMVGAIWLMGSAIG